VMTATAFGADDESSFELDGRVFMLSAMCAASAN